jgi:hypothetical protein
MISSNSPFSVTDMSVRIEMGLIRFVMMPLLNKFEKKKICECEVIRHNIPRKDCMGCFFKFHRKVGVEKSS